MNVSVGDPIIISEGISGGAIHFAAERGLGGGGGPPISSGELTVSVQVNVTFETS